MSEQMMEDPRIVAATHDLGNLREEYKPAITWIIVLWSILIAFAVVGGGYFLFAGSLMSFEAGPGIIALIIVFIVILVGISKIKRAYNNRATRVLVYDAGLFYNGRDGILTIRWEDIVQVEHEVIKHRHTTTNSNGATTTHTTYSHRYIVRCFEGTYLKLDENFVGLRRLGKTIEEQSAHYLLPIAMKALLADEVVPFGAFSVSMAGIHAGGRILPWNELKKVNIDEREGSVAIRKQGKLLNWSSARLVEVPNVVVFKVLVDKMVAM